ncbi:MAG: Na/Pi cotransporter family protein [Saprospiraceae bacterium]|nr:Na/Pi cotransporter family protein [Saprospiraceae bacterium]
MIEFSWEHLWQIVGATCIFIYGMKRMSESVQRAAGEQFRQILGKLTRNKWASLFTGMLITGVIQSSSAFTVMLVSFVNAGLLTAAESAAFIMGSNIRTTVTGWLVSLFGFKISMSEYAVPLFSVGLPLLFVSSGKWKYWGETILGLALIFLGLGFLRDAIPLSSENTQLFSWVSMLSHNGLISRIIFVFIGMVVTLILQSSSVAMAITLTLCLQGWIPLEMAASLILGENIGTTSTALIASLVASKEAKVAAFIHVWFNLLGVAWMVIMLPWVLQGLAVLLLNVFGVRDIQHQPMDMTIGLAAFHTLFNVMQALWLIHFIPWLHKLACATAGVAPENGTEKNHAGSLFLDAGAILPEMASIQLQRETLRFGETIASMANDFTKILSTTDREKQLRLIRKIEDNEEATDRLEREITTYITSLSKEQITAETSVILRSILNICNDLERIADLYYQLTVTYRKKMEQQVYFLPEQRECLHQMHQLVIQAIQVMNENLATPDFKDVSIYHAGKIEKKINQMRNALRSEYALQLSNPDFNVQSGAVYSNIFMSLERIGDHIVNVTEAIAGEI